jgi:hypothetical protein
MSALDCEACNPLLAMSTVFSWFGLLYAGIPLAILLITAKCLMTSTCRMFWLVVSGGISAVAALCALYAFAENRPELDDHVALLAHLSACLGAVFGVLCFRFAHGLASRNQPRDSHIG